MYNNLNKSIDKLVPITKYEQATKAPIKKAMTVFANS
jgi:hypothetical protein